MKGRNYWVIATIAVIWLLVLILSLQSDPLVTGTEQNELPVAAFVNWIWGLLATVAVLRATVFRKPNEKGWGQDYAWMWIMIVISGIWVAATIVALSFPPLVTGDDPISIPFGAIVAPVIAAVLTNYASEFLVEGFAARSGQKPLP